jgi:hypothetical protein
MQIGDITKLVVAVLIAACVTLLAFYGKIAEQAVTALLGALIGYVLGNGHSAASTKIMELKNNK